MKGRAAGMHLGGIFMNKKNYNGKIKIRKFHRCAAALLLCALMTAQPLGAVFALDIYDAAGQTANAAETAADEAKGVAAEENITKDNEYDTEEEASAAADDSDSKMTIEAAKADENVPDGTDASAADADSAELQEDSETEGEDYENDTDENAGLSDGEDGQEQPDDPSKGEEPEKADTVNYSWYICAGGESAASYTIADAASLAGFARLVNGTDLPEGEQTVAAEDGTLKSAVLSQTDFKDKKIILINDIDLSSAEGGWTPAGTAACPFAGTFDGNGKKITGVNINDISVNEADAAGFFGYLSGAASDLKLSGSITVTADASVKNTGGIAGVLSGGRIADSVSYVDISAGSGNAGGIAGRLYGGAVIERSGNYGAVSATGGGAAGAAGSLTGDAALRHVYNLGSIAGESAAGIACSALADGTSAALEYCFSTGSVNGSAASGMVLTGAASGGCKAKACFGLEGSAVSGSAEDETVVTAVSQDAFRNGSVAWALNTCSGSEPNNELWTQGADAPVLCAESQNGPVYRLDVSSADGADISISYTDGGNSSEKTEETDEPDEAEALQPYRVTDETENVYYYIFKGNSISIKAAPAADTEEADAAPYAYMTVKDAEGRISFSASTSDFAKNGLSLECAPESDMMSVGLELYDAASDPDKKVTVTFECNGGAFDADSEKTSVAAEADYGSLLSDLLRKTADPEYLDGEAEFTGWYTDQGLKYEADGNALLTGDITLYAGWRLQCTVTFDLNGYGGSEDITDWPLDIVMYTGDRAESQSVPVWVSDKNGNGTITRHNFLGWFTDPEAGTEWNFEDPVVSGMTLYAHWEHVTVSESDTSGGVSSISGSDSFEKLLGTIQDGVSYEGQTIAFDNDITLEAGVNISSFDGILDGKGHTLTLSKKQFTSSGSSTALFTTLKSGAVIKNLNIVYDGGSVLSSAKFALLCDTNYGTIENCNIKLVIQRIGSSDDYGGTVARINASTGVIKDCKLLEGSDIQFNGSYGGIVGLNNGTVDTCETADNVKISATLSAGGIAYKSESAAQASEDQGTGTGGGTGTDTGAGTDQGTGTGGSSGTDTGTGTETGTGGDSGTGSGTGTGTSTDTGSGTGTGGEGGSTGGDAENPDTDPDTSSEGEAIIKNCLAEAAITSGTRSGQTADDTCSGGIVAFMTGGTLQALTEKCYFTGRLSARGAAGGIAGILDGSTDNTVIKDCWTSGTIADAYDTGGIAGNIKAGTVQTCYSRSAIKGASKAAGGIAGTGASGTISSCYWFGDSFAPLGSAETGMFCGGTDTGVVVTNCYYGTPDDNPDCTTDIHMSADDENAAVRNAAEFADGSVAWDLETLRGTQKLHLRSFSMNTKPVTDENGKTTVKKDTSGSEAETGAFTVTEAENYVSPVISTNSIYKVEMTVKESTDENVSWDSSKDYVKATIGNTEIRAYAAKPAEGEEDTQLNVATAYLYGSNTLKWTERTSSLHDVLADVVNERINKEYNDDYNLIITCNVNISDTEGNILKAYSSKQFNLLGFTFTYEMTGYDMRIDADIHKIISLDQTLEPEEGDKKTDEETKPSPSKKHHSSSSGRGNSGSGTGSGGNGSAPSGSTDGSGSDRNTGLIIMPGSQTVTRSDEPSDNLDIVLPVQAESAPADTEVTEPEAVTEPEPEAAPEGAAPDEPQEDMDEPQEDIQEPLPQSVFEVIRKSVTTNPLSALAAVLVIIAIMILAGVRRWKKNQ